MDINSKKNVNFDLAESIFKIRKKNGLSQEEFAKKIGITRQAVSQWEKGTSIPSLENLITISDIFKISIDDLLKRNIDYYQNIIQKQNFFSIINLFFICIGIVGLISLPLLAEYKRFKEMYLFNSAYEHSMNYIFEYPLCILLSFFSLITIGGICILIKKIKMGDKK